MIARTNPANAHFDRDSNIQFRFGYSVMPGSGLSDNPLCGSTGNVARTDNHIYDIMCPTNMTGDVLIITGEHEYFSIGDIMLHEI